MESQYSDFEHKVALAIGLATKGRLPEEIGLARQELEQKKENWINPDTIGMTDDKVVFFATFITTLRDYLERMTCDRSLVDSAKLDIRISNITDFFEKKKTMFTVTFSDDYEPLDLHYTSYGQIENHELLNHKQGCCGYSCDYYGCDIYGDGISHRIGCDGNMCKTYRCISM